MNNEVENHGGSTETSTKEKRKKGCWRKILDRAVNWLSHKENKKNWITEMRGNLSLVATVIATMTFQMALNPPGGVMSIKDSTKLLSANANPPVANANPPGADDFDTYSNFEDYCNRYNDETSICPGEAVLALGYPDDYFKFLVSNTICFIASLSICLLLVSGIRFHHRFPMWLLSIGMCVTLTSLAISYITAVKMTTPDLIFDKSSNFLLRLIRAWVVLLSFIGLCLTLRLVTWGVKSFCKKPKKSKTKKGTKETTV